MKQIAKGEINVPITLSVFRDKNSLGISVFKAFVYVVDDFFGGPRGGRLCWIITLLSLCSKAYVFLGELDFAG